MSVHVSALCWQIPSTVLTGHEKLVLLCLADHAHDDGGSCFPGQERIAAHCCLAVRTVRTALQRLTDLGLTVTVLAPKGRRTARRQIDLLAVAAAIDGRTRRPATVAGLPKTRPAKHDTGRPANPARRPATVAADPLVTVRSEPSVLISVKGPEVSYLGEQGQEPEDWFTECKRLHGRACSGRYAHSLKMGIDADRARRTNEHRYVTAAR